MNLFIPLIFLISGCTGNTSSIQIDTKDSLLTNIEEKNANVIPYKKFVFPINNKDKSEFAYIKGDLFDGGIKSMIINGEYCFFIDEVHRNVKKINLKNGEKTVSKVLVDVIGRSLVDIFIHNELIYVSSRDKNIFVLNSDLKLIKIIEIKTQGNNNLIFNGTRGDNLLMFISVKDSIVEIDTLGNEINRIKVKPYPSIGAKVTSTGVRSGQIVNDTILTSSLDKELYYYTYFEWNKNSYIRGKKYKILKEKDAHYFVTDKYKAKLTLPYTHLENTDIDFIADLDFTDNYLVIFEITPPSITIHVYNTNDN